MQDENIKKMAEMADTEIRDVPTLNILLCYLLYKINHEVEIEQLYEIAADLQEKAENGADDIDLKTQLSQIENVIRTYEEIVEGNYIDNLIKAERERREAEQKKENSPEQPMQTVNRKKHKKKFQQGGTK